MASEPGLRERKKARTRRTIEAAALDLFERSGFYGVTIDEIASAADIAPRTFFHYFGTKEQVVLAELEARLGRVVAGLAGRPTDESPWSALRSTFMEVAADHVAHREQHLRRLRLVHSTPALAAANLEMQARWERTVAAEVATRLGVDPARDIRPALLAGSAVTVVRAAMALWVSNDGRDDLPDLVANGFDLLAGGLGEVRR